jgi:cyclohexanecarboxylate-CoA ligase
MSDAVSPNGHHLTSDNPRAGGYDRPGGPWDAPPLGLFLERLNAEEWVLVDGSVRMNGSEVAAAARALADELRQRGVNHGDIVAWQLPNWYEAVLLFRACWLVGAVAFPILHKLREADLEEVLEEMDPKVSFAAPGTALTELRSTLPVRSEGSVFPLTIKGDYEVLAPQAESADLAIAMLTSGSTGRSKIVLHAHRSLAYKAKSKPEVYGLVQGDTVLVAGPLAHINGLVNAVLLPPAAGMNVVLMESWDPQVALELIEAEQVTFFGGPSVFLTGMIEHPSFSAERLGSLKVAAMGGSSMTSEAIASIAKRLDCTVKRTYGSTEAPSVTTTYTGDPVAKGWTTDGRPSGEAEIRISDPNTGRALAPGEVGEIWIRGPELFVGYADAKDTQAALRDGWFRSGDLGSMDKDGWLTVRGRIKELIIRGGENISPLDVEDVVRSHPMVDAVVAVAYPDDILGERVGIAVVADPEFSIEVCREWFAKQRIARFKTPELVVHVDVIPMSSTGKPDRLAVRDIVLARIR